MKAPNPIATLRGLMQRGTPAPRRMTTEEYLALDLTGRIGADLSGAISPEDRPYRIGLSGADRKALAPIVTVPEHLTIGQARALIAKIRDSLGFFGTQRARTAIAWAVLRIAAPFGREAEQELTGGARRPADWLASVERTASGPTPASPPAPAGDESENVSKFNAGTDGSHVKIRYPLRGPDPEDAVKTILAAFPDGSPHEKVAAALAKIGASFADWIDGLPGWALAYRAARPDPLSVACPMCNAVVGARCTNYKNQGCAPHGARVRHAHEAARAPAVAAAVTSAEKSAAEEATTLVLRALDKGLVLQATDRNGCALTCGPSPQLLGPMRWAIYRYGAACRGAAHEEHASSPHELVRLLAKYLDPTDMRRSALRALEAAGELDEGELAALDEPELTEDTALDALRALPPGATEDETLGALEALRAPPRPKRRRAEPRLQMESFGLTDVGRMRRENQDAFRIEVLGKTGEVYVVADGLGGMGGGDVASSVAVDAVAQALPALLPVTEAKLRGLVEAANREVIEEQGRRGGRFAQMGTTLTIAVVVDRRLFVAHTGDSRCYLLHEGHARPLTDDQTVAQNEVREGKITPQQALHHQLRHALTSCVGCTTADLDVQTREVPLRPGDAVALCSDGLHDRVSDDDIAAIVRTATSSREACEQLVTLANQRGGQDNITVIVAIAREAGR
jgi:protein phosphatase